MDELIAKCNELGIDYINKKTNKPYGKPALMKRIEEADKPVDVKIEIKYLNEIVWKKETTMICDKYREVESGLNNLIRKCHQILYSNGSIVGGNAMKDIIKLIILRFINLIYATDKGKETIDTLFDSISGDAKLKYKDYIIDLIKILDGTDANYQNKFRCYIGNVINKIIPDIFKAEDITFNTNEHPQNLISLTQEICGFIKIEDKHLSDFFSTHGGNLYEYFINNYGKGGIGKDLGQFFTPYPLITAVLNGAKFNDLIREIENPSIYDPCCGSAGLLCITYNENKDFIGSNQIYGCETEKDTIKFALGSIILNTNEFNTNIKNCNSLTQNPYLLMKFNVIFTNPPFGIKCNLKDLKENFKSPNEDIKFNDIYPLNINDATAMFIQLVIYQLAENGVCAIVLPDGKLTSASNFYKLRKFIIDNTKIISIISIENGAFGHTGVKTKIVIFKKIKSEDNYKNINFYEINKECNEVKLITITDLNKSTYSFDLSKEEEAIEYNDDIEIKTLGEVCEFKNGKRIVKGEVPTGEYPVLGGGGFTSFYTNEYTREGKTCKISREGMSEHNCVMILNEKYYLNSQAFTITSNNRIILNDEYLWYYLNNIKNKIYNCGRGSAQKAIDIEKFNKLKIPIPSMEKQNEIVETLDEFQNANSDMEKTIEHLKNLNKRNLNISISSCIDIQNIRFGEIFELVKGKIQSSKIVEDENGKGVMVTQSKNRLDYKKIKHWVVDGKNLFIGNIDSGKKFCINYYNGKCDYTNLLSLCKIKTEYEEKIDITYIYYYLFNIKDILLLKYLKGAANLSLDIEKFNNLKIPIPSLEKQKEIVDYCDRNQVTIDNLKKTIEDNKNLMKQVFTQIEK